MVQNAKTPLEPIELPRFEILCSMIFRRTAAASALKYEYSSQEHGTLKGIVAPCVLSTGNNASAAAMPPSAKLRATTPVFGGVITINSTLPVRATYAITTGDQHYLGQQ